MIKKYLLERHNHVKGANLHYHHFTPLKNYVTLCDVKNWINSIEYFHLLQPKIYKLYRIKSKQRVILGLIPRVFFNRLIPFCFGSAAGIQQYKNKDGPFVGYLIQKDQK